MLRSKEVQGFDDSCSRATELDPAFRSRSQWKIGVGRERKCLTPPGRREQRTGEHSERD